MAVTRNYTLPTTILTCSSVKSYFNTAQKVTVGYSIYRVLHLDYKLKRAVLLGNSVTVKTPYISKNTSKGANIFSTYPPIYKTSLGAKTIKFPTPRVYPPIFITPTR